MFSLTTDLLSNLDKLVNIGSDDESSESNKELNADESKIDTTEMDEAKKDKITKVKKRKMFLEKYNWSLVDALASAIVEMSAVEYNLFVSNLNCLNLFKV